MRPRVAGIERQRGQCGAGSGIEVRVDAVDDLGGLGDFTVEAGFGLRRINPLVRTAGAGAIAHRPLLDVPARAGVVAFGLLDRADEV
jgi:hypothetical protein